MLNKSHTYTREAWYPGQLFEFQRDTTESSSNTHDPRVFQCMLLYEIIAYKKKKNYICHFFPFRFLPLKAVGWLQLIKMTLYNHTHIHTHTVHCVISAAYWIRPISQQTCPNPEHTVYYAEPQYLDFSTWSRNKTLIPFPLLC